jgi:hypothetical protein
MTDRFENQSSNHVRESVQADGLNLLDLQIRQHERYDRSQSQLARALNWATGLVWSGDQKTLDSLKQIRSGIDTSQESGVLLPANRLAERIKQALKADREALGLRAEISHYGTGFVKTVGLFLPGASGKIGAVCSFGLDQMKSGDGLATQLVDGGLGGLKGGLLYKTFSILGANSLSLSPATKGFVLGFGSRALEVGLDRQTWKEETSGQKFSLSAGTARWTEAIFNRNAVLADVATFTMAHGLTAGANTLTGGLVERSRLFSTILTGSSFGLTNGALGEIQRQRSYGEELDVWKITQRSLLQAAIDSVAAVPGGCMNAMALRAGNTNNQIKLEKLGAPEMAKALSGSRSESVREGLKSVQEDGALLAKPDLTATSKAADSPVKGVGNLSGRVEVPEPKTACAVESALGTTETAVNKQHIESGDLAKMDAEVEIVSNLSKFKDRGVIRKLVRQGVLKALEADPELVCDPDKCARLLRVLHRMELNENPRIREVITDKVVKAIKRQPISSPDLPARDQMPLESIRKLISKDCGLALESDQAIQVAMERRMKGERGAQTLHASNTTVSASVSEAQIPLVASRPIAKVPEQMIVTPATMQRETPLQRFIKSQENRETELGLSHDTARLHSAAERLQTDLRLLNARVSELDAREFKSLSAAERKELSESRSILTREIERRIDGLKLGGAVDILDWGRANLLMPQNSSLGCHVQMVILRDLSEIWSRKLALRNRSGLLESKSPRELGLICLATKHQSALDRVGGDALLINPNSGDVVFLDVSLRRKDGTIDGGAELPEYRKRGLMTVREGMDISERRNMVQCLFQDIVQQIHCGRFPINLIDIRLPSGGDAGSQKQGEDILRFRNDLYQTAIQVPVIKWLVWETVFAKTPTLEIENRERGLREWADHNRTGGALEICGVRPWQGQMTPPEFQRASERFREEQFK